MVEEKYKLIPADGIFAVKVQQADTEYKGMAYIGSRPTINGMNRNIEVNLFNFDKEIYNETIRMEFLHFIRGDVKFNGLDELKAQITKDKEDVLSLLGR
ncbi:riboflavin kinase [Mucilaginibacter humi]|uniref:riboflavin kinase n=1 Tax=Mucilaginibacter humi TaxID=2732510 RepID=UPI00293BDC3B|nr:riboflavin kinase [Mucilaginibacter humi]